MKRKFFLRRACKYFFMLLIPTLVLFAVFIYLTLTSQAQSLLSEGEQTLEAVSNNCSAVILSVVEQNEVLTSLTRTSMMLKRVLNNSNVSYADSIYMKSLRSTLSSMLTANDALDNILIWLDDAPRVFTSWGSGIAMLETAQDVPWLKLYQEMPKGVSTRIAATETASGGMRVTVIRRLLMQKGCTVSNIAVERWAEVLATLLHRQHEYLFLSNTEGEILIHVTNADSELPADAVQALLSAPTGQWFSYQGEWYLVSSTETNGVVINAIITSQLLIDRMSMVAGTFLSFFALDLVLVLLLAYLTTRRICHQMLRMIDAFDNALQGVPVERPVGKIHDEYDVMMNNIVYMYLRDTESRDRIREETYQKECAEMLALQLQINPHFLYNTLQTLDICIRSGKADRLDLCDMIHDLSNILKYALGDPHQPVTLQEELNCLKAYAAIQKFRFGGRFVIYYEVDDCLLDCRVFRMMYQPLVENSMLHGLHGLSERGYIWVRTTCAEGMLRVSVKDSGVGMTEESRLALLEHINDESSRSIGLTNLNRRLVLRYGPQSALQIASAPGQGMTVSFTIPLERVQADEVSEIIPDRK